MRLDVLRAANVARAAHWPGNEKADLPFRGLELAGEVGELCNKVKKLHRLRAGIGGNRDVLAEEGLIVEIAEELGDVLITLDLLAMDLGLDLGPVAADKFNQKSEEVGIPIFIGLDAGREAAIQDLSGIHYRGGEV
uniref:MazG-like family protein n=1 Tax=Ruegeria arenilitoris TaxID=1173585 RepID=UPI0014818E95|nr:MazG-like family protein [Ruegeria arenilitoris]